ncbi:hypothetical protein SO802_030365 [Lithocarpus litseifolius]|uniref:Uncharacterized protein n=1 Tax=Lithocarpus litseifolius TaxID=425828 RepID=A0AAW2BKT7_9ROSI
MEVVGLIQRWRDQVRTLNDHRPAVLDAISEPPPLFDGTTRLYITYTCPHAQRVWILRNYKVPSLEHNGKVIGESLDLLKYVDSNFEGPTFHLNDPAKKEFVEELTIYSDTFIKILFASFKGDTVKEAGPCFDYLENALHKFNDGPFLLGHEFNMVDIVYITFVEKSQDFLSAVWNYDITAGRPKLARWIEEINKIDAYKSTKTDPKVTVEFFTLRIEHTSTVPLDFNK